MLQIFKSLTDDELIQIQNIEKGAWINLVNPNEEEIEFVTANTGIFSEFIRYPLDEEERPHIESEDGQILVLINVPLVLQKDIIYDTIPLGIIVTDDFIVTICLEEVDILKELYSRKTKGFATFKKTRFVFQLLYKNASLYLKFLRGIDRKSNEIELELHKSMRNKELISLMNLEKSLVYFSTSLRSNEIVLEKLMRGKLIKMYEEDEDLLEDVIIENKQAIEMANIYSNILSGTMDAFASIISNNLNIVMKFLAAVTIVLALPTMVASFFGMNVSLPFENSPHGFVIVITISILLSLTGIMYLAKKDMF